MANRFHKIFIDSSVYIAFVDRADKNHSYAVKAIENLARLGFQTYTSNQAIQEAFTAIRIDMGVSVALDFLEAVLESNTEILFPQKTELIKAYRLLRSNREKEITLRETLYAVLMEKKGISRIVTFGYWHNLLGTSAHTPIN